MNAKENDSTATQRTRNHFEFMDGHSKNGAMNKIWCYLFFEMGTR